MISVRFPESLEHKQVQELCELLIDAVEGGASVGFLAPLSNSVALDYWDGVAAALGPGLDLIVAEQDGRIVGAVQLAYCSKQNGRHRAEVQKLFVLQDFRGKGVASKLMHALEQRAVSEGISLLVLDTIADSPAESIYRHLGWIRCGEIPDYAANPDGTLHATAYFYKKVQSD